MPIKNAAMPAFERRTIGISDAVQTYGIGRDKLYSLIADGRITSYRLGGKRLIDVASVEALLASLRLPPSAAAATSATLAAARAARAERRA